MTFVRLVWRTRVTTLTVDASRIGGLQIFLMRHRYVRPT